MGETRVRALYASYGLISLLLYLPFGLLVDRWGERSLLTVGMLILGCVSLGFWQATGFGSLLGCRFGQGIAASATWAAALPLATRIATKERRGVEMSVLTVALSIGAIAGRAFGSLGQVPDPLLCFAWIPFALAVCIFILMPGVSSPSSPYSPFCLTPFLTRRVTAKTRLRVVSHSGNVCHYRCYRGAAPATVPSFGLVPPRNRPVLFGLGTRHVFIQPVNWMVVRPARQAGTDSIWSAYCDGPCTNTVLCS